MKLTRSFKYQTCRIQLKSGMFFFLHGRFSRVFEDGNVGMPGFPCGVSLHLTSPDFWSCDIFFLGGGWEELLTVTNKIYQKMVGLIYAMKFTTIEFFETSGGLILMPHMLPYVGCMVEWYIYLTWFFRGFLLGSRWVNYTISIHLDPIGF